MKVGRDLGHPPQECGRCRKRGKLSGSCAQCLLDGGDLGHVGSSVMAGAGGLSLRSTSPARERARRSADGPKSSPKTVATEAAKSAASPWRPSRLTYA